MEFFHFAVRDRQRATSSFTLHKKKKKIIAKKDREKWGEREREGVRKAIGA